MNEKIVSLNDKHSIRDLINGDKNISDRINGKVKKTKITITDHDSGEVLGVYENKVVITGSMFSGCKAFGINTDLDLPTYNDEMHFDEDQEKIIGNYDKSIVQLFCVGDDGCGSTQRDVYPVNYTDRIKPLTDLDNIELGCIYPFRFQNADDDLPQHQPQHL
jgi:hypothetical protein